MALADRNPAKTRPNLDGIQHVFDLPNGYGLSFINAPMAHAYPYAWEAGVFGPNGKLTYDTPLTNDVEVFDTEADAEAFLDKALAWAATVPA